MYGEFSIDHRWLVCLGRAKSGRRRESLNESVGKVCIRTLSSPSSRSRFGYTDLVHRRATTVLNSPLPWLERGTMGKMSCSRTKRKILGQDSNPDKSIRSRVQYQGGYINTCILVPGLEVLNHIIVSKTNKIQLGMVQLR